MLEVYKISCYLDFKVTKKLNIQILLDKECLCWLLHDYLLYRVTTTICLFTKIDVINEDCIACCFNFILLQNTFVYFIFNCCM